MKTTIKNKGEKHERQKAERQETQKQTVLTVIHPAGGSVVVSDQPDSLRLYRLTNSKSIQPFEPDIVDLFKTFIKKSGENAQISRENLYDYIAYCDRQEVFFIIGVDKDYKCRMYCLAHAMIGGIFFIRQLVLSTKYNAKILEYWKFIETLARDSGCSIIESNTKRDERAYTRWISKFGMKRECTVYRKGVA